MDIYDFIEKYNIALLAQIDLNHNIISVIKNNINLESYDLFEQLILYNDVEDLKKYVDGQTFPRIWAQGNSKCVICEPFSGKLIALFYDSDLNAKDNFFYAEHLNSVAKYVLDCTGSDSKNDTPKF